MPCVENASPRTETPLPHLSAGAGADNSGLIHLTLEAAESFYRMECRNANVCPNNTFVKQLLAGATVFDFDNGYLGERGIVPILSTLQRLPVVELSMRNCEITTDDVGLIYQTFLPHNTLRKIDLRGVTLTVSSARKLLALAVQNSRITQILLDESTPKNFYIQKQCVANANATILASRCALCNTPIIYSQDQKIENRLLLSFDVELNATQPVATGIALQVMFRSILACCEVSDGVLFLCSGKCQMQLTNDIITAMRAGVAEWFSSDNVVYPRNSLLRRCVIDTLKIMKKNLKKDVNEVGVDGCSDAISNVMSKTKNAKGRDVYYQSKDDKDDSDDSSNSEKECDGVLEECTICGTHAVCLENPALAAMRQIFSEIQSGFLLRPSGLLRLAKLMLSYTEMRCCSKDCVIHLARYGLYGYGGVLQPRAVSTLPRVSSIGVSLKYLPYEDFTILNFSAAQVDELEEEDISCALTVASAMSDFYGVPIDPYMIFAVGRQLAKLSPDALGMELRSACEAVQLVGCLPVTISPFDRRKQRPLRRKYVCWDKWGEHTDMDVVMRVAFSRRRQGLYVIDGPHTNLFDNARAALWAFQQQRCAVLVAMRFFFEWLSSKNGVIANESSLKQSFSTTLKVVGQSLIQNTIYVICQTNFGVSFGNRGFFYIPRGIFNLYALGDAFIFVDATVCDSWKGQKESLYAAQLLPKEAVFLVEHLPLLQKLFCWLDEALNWKTRNRLKFTRSVCEKICRLPPSMFDFFSSCGRGVSENQVEILKKIRQYAFTNFSRSILLFYIYEVLGPLATKWIYHLLEHLPSQTPFLLLMREAAESAGHDDVMRRQSQGQWVSPATVKKTVTMAPERQVTRLTKKTRLHRSVKTVEKKVVKDTRDIFLAKLEQRWASERKKISILREHFHNASLVSSGLVRRDSIMVNRTTAHVAESLAHGNDLPIPLELIGHSWQSVRLCDADGQLGDYVMFFVKNYVCCIRLANQAVAVPLHPILKSGFLRNFPFSGGFDCALNSPVNPRIAYFFSGEQWCEWDTYQQTCTGGPFKLRLHRQFEELPADFLGGIDAAIPVPNTSFVIFFSQLKYVVFDLVQQRTLGDVRSVYNLEACEENIPTFNSCLSKMFPTGPMATILRRADEEEEDEEKEENKNGESTKGDEELPKYKTSLQMRKMLVMLIGRDGSVAVVHSFSSSMLAATVTDKLLTLPVSSLSGIPLVLRQMTTAALQYVCNEVLYAECSRAGFVLNNTPAVGRQNICAITSTFASKREESSALLSIIRRDGGQNLMPLLRDEVVFIQTEESMLGEPPQVIEFDYGFTRRVAFAALVLVLDTSRIDSRIFRVAPIEAVVESSDDSVTYIRHTHFVATPFVTAVCWGEAHAARFWRVKILTRLPVSTGIVRALWYEASRVPRSIPLCPAVPYGPPESVEVNIIAPEVFCSPQKVLKPFVSDYVFTSPPIGGWLMKHCVLPVFFNEKVSCLFFCGNNFVELDLENRRVRSHRSISFASHPAFANLPYPFSLGFSTAFYPNRQNTHIVALVHGDNIILWNIHSGCSENNVEGKSPDSFFENLPWKLEEVDNIVQIWDSFGEFFIIKKLQVLRWNIYKMVVVEGPMPLKHCPYFYYPEFDGEQILCIASLPDAPRRFYVFSEDRVAVQTVTDNIISDKVGPLQLRHFDLFSSVTWYLKWGVRRHDTVINIDLKEEQPLLIGIQMRSCGSSDEEWLIEYSDDGVEWSTAVRHTQSSVISRTMWNLLSVKNCSHRFWRLSTDYSSCKPGNAHHKPLLYMSILFLTLPSAPYRQLAQTILLSGTLNGPMSALFIDETATVAFEDMGDSSSVDTSPLTPHHITIDYGETNIPDLMGFSCQCTGTRQNFVWSVFCGNNGEKWEKCGVWRSCFKYMKFSWKPRGPRRFWRLELQSSYSNALFENFCLYEYTGSSLFLENSSLVGDGWDPSVMWEKKNFAGYKVPPVTFLANVEAAVILDTKRTAAHVVGVRIVGNEDQNSSTEFVVECSTNAVKWQSLNKSFLLRGNIAQAVWQGGDYCRFWRLRIVHHIGPPFLALNAICFEIASPSLYRAIVAKNTAVVEELTGYELCLGDDSQEVVALKAVLPPKTMCGVEKLSIDGAEWEMVATVENNDIIHPQTIFQGWISRGISSNWRLLPVADDLSEENKYGVNVSHSFDHVDNSSGGGVFVKWYSFSRKSMVESKFFDNPNVQVTTSGFIEEQDPKHLGNNVTDTVVLRSVENKTSAFVTWVFDQDRIPTFNYVYLKSRVDTFCDLQQTPLPIPELPKPTRKSSSVTRFQSLFRHRRSQSSSGSVLKSGKSSVDEGNKRVKKTPLTVVVEVSDNGVNFLPLAEQCVLEVGNALSWQSGTSAQYWRLRFKGISETNSLVLFQVVWFVERSVVAFPAQQGSSCAVLSQSIYSTWRGDCFNHEKEFCKKSREAYEQARSVASGLREADEIDSAGRVAQRVAYFKDEFTKFVSKAVKEASKDKNIPINKFISVGRQSSNDVMYLLYKAAVTYNCNVDDLNTLISHPMLFSRDVKRSLGDLLWFYPFFEQNGTLVESFYGFHNVRASLLVLWSLSLQIQKNTDLLFHSSMTPLSPHIATVVITVNISHTNWVAAEHFPNLPLLYYVGFSGRPMVIAFVLNQVTFTSQYNLLIPGAEPFPARYPFKLYPGANFIQRIPLALCVSPVFDCLHMLYSTEFLAKYETEVVFTTSTMSSGVAVVRFTLPGEGINFGIPELTIGSIEFEAQLVMEDSSDFKRDSSSCTTVSYLSEKECQMMMFVTHEALIYKQGGDDELPMSISLAGCINVIEEKITVRGMSPNAHFPVSCWFPNAFLTNMNLFFEVLLSGTAPRSFIKPTLRMEGLLSTPSYGSYTCCFLTSCMENRYNHVSLEAMEVQLMQLIRLGNYILEFPLQSEGFEWLSTVPISLSLILEKFYSENRFVGCGTMRFANTEGDAEAIFSSTGISITGKVKSLKIGGILLHGKSSDDNVIVNICTPANDLLVIRLDGYSSLLASNPYPTKVEICKAGVVCVSVGVFYDICIEENSVLPSGTYAQVSVSRSVVMECLSKLMQENAFIVAILAKGIPFSFDVEEVVADECCLERRFLSLSVRGVLFGSWFDVMAFVTSPENNLQEAYRVCQSLLPQIFEQCDGQLWALHKMVSSGLASLEETNKEENNEVGEPNAVVKNEEAFDGHFTLKMHFLDVLKEEKDSFWGFWAARECEEYDVSLCDEFGALLCNESTERLHEFGSS